MKPVIAHCVWNYYPWVADMICKLKKYDSIICTSRSQSLEGNVAGYPLPIYASHTADNPALERLLNRVTNRIFGVPYIFYRAGKEHRVVMLHAHLAPQGLAFLPMAKRLGLPLLTSFHGHHLYTYLPSSPVLMAATRQLFEEGSLFTAVSAQMRKDAIAIGCPPEKVIVHHVGVDVDEFAWCDRAWPTDEIVLLTVSNFAKRKGLPYLIRAFALVRNEFLNVELRIVGGNPFGSEVEAEVRSLIRELALSDSVILTGFKSRSEVKQEYQRAHIFVLPSVTAPHGEREGIPVVLMEAMATGLPVVSTYHAGIPELVVDGQSGYLVPEKDCHALAAAILELLHKPSLWSPMGRVGRSQVEKHFNLERQIRELEIIYHRMLEAHKNSAS